MSEIIIKPLDEAEEYSKELDRLRHEFCDSKTFCCCVPGGIGTEKEAAKDYKKCPELKKVCGIAISPEKGVVGFCQMTFEGMPNLIHTTKPGEAYILMLAVDTNARGMGVGSKLMAWAEEMGRARKSSYMSLEVIHGNPAIGLYERKGYVVQKKALWKKLLCAVPYMLFIGPVIRTSNSPRYCTYGQTYYKKKPLE